MTSIQDLLTLPSTFTPYLTKTLELFLFNSLLFRPGLCIEYGQTHQSNCKVFDYVNESEKLHQSNRKPNFKTPSVLVSNLIYKTVIFFLFQYDLLIKYQDFRTNSGKPQVDGVNTLLIFNRRIFLSLSLSFFVRLFLIIARKWP